MRKNKDYGQIDYRRCAYPLGKTCRWIGEGAALTCLLNFLFYMRWIAFAWFAPACLLWVRYRARHFQKERQRKLNYDFREALDSLAVALRGGFSAENAFLETERNLRSSCGETDLTREFAIMNGGIAMSRQPEEMLWEFAVRSGCEDILNFAAVFENARKTGGSMTEVIASAAGMISGKIDVERDIALAVAGKEYEQKIMALMPAAIVFYIRLVSPGFMDVMYDGAFGMLVMTACLAVYILSVWWGRCLTRIEV